MAEQDKSETPAVLIGYKGVKYGLQRGRKTRIQTKPDVFGDDSSEDESVEAQVAQQQQKNATAAKIQAARAAAIAKDNTVYEYDSVYDDIQRERQTSKEREVEQRKPKYIEDLIRKAQVRKKEQDIAYERRLLKERKQDDHLYDQKDAFITAAYKNKLKEDKYWVEREKYMDAVEEAEDVTKKADLSGFYQNLCGKNVAFASNRLAPMEFEAEKAEVPRPSVDSLQAVKAMNSEPRDVEPDRAEEKSPSPDPSRAVGDGRKKEKREEPPLEAESANPTDTAGRKKRRNDASSITSARERYLARKRAFQAE